MKLLRDLEKISKAPDEEKLQVLIIGAGWANHLSGTSDAFLRNHLHDISIVVFAVAFEDVVNFTHTQAAISSITDVPGTKTIFNHYVGSDGFYRACCDAASLRLQPIELPKPRDPIEYTLRGAIAKSKELAKKINEKEK